MRGRTARRAWTGVLAGALALTAGAALPAGAGAQQFGPARLHPAGDGVRALALADLDGDAHADVLLRQAPDHLALAPGDGRGGLGDPVRLPGPALEHVADLDGAGPPDLVDVAERDGALVVRARLADGRGGFGEPVESAAGGPAGRVAGLAAGRVDGDEHADLVVAVEDGASGARLWVARGEGDGRFAAWSDAGGSPGRRPVLLPDLDGDGRGELALAGAGSVWVHPSAPGGGFGPGREHRVGPTGEALGALATGRFARAGGPAVAVVVPTRGCVALLDPLAPDDDAPCRPTAGAPDGLAAGDVDGDRVTDLVHGAPRRAAGLLLGRAGPLAPAEPVPLDALTSATSDPLLGDLDEDGRPDLVVVANLRSLAVLLNAGRPELALSAARLRFGPQVVGRASAPRTLVVRNTGSWPLTGLAGAEVTGPGAGDFTVTADRCRGTELVPGAACTVRVRFRPRSRGRRTAALVLAASREVTLAGRGVARPRGA